MCKLFIKQKLCDKCANLISKVGREYKCPMSHGILSTYTKAPSYCKNFKQREKTDDEVS